MDDPVRSAEDRPEDLPEDPLEELLAGCLEGAPEENAAALERVCAQHPEHADELRRRVAALAALGLGGEPTARSHEFPEHLGEFDLIERLGGGGMGVVFRARQTSLERDVALKVIRPEHLFFPHARERFRRETEAVARLQHPGIVPIYVVGEDGGVPYFAMELVQGCTLAGILQRLAGRAPERIAGADVWRAMCDVLGPRVQGRAPPPFFDAPWLALCLRWAIEVADALAHAHERGVMHRDVKPSNIAITLEGAARLIDFGLASMGGDDRGRLTASGAALGSLMYMSPEQVRGESRIASARSDVYALGVTLHEMLSLQAPYRDTSPVDLRQAILDGRVDALRTRNRAVSRDLEVVCGKAMESAPSQRYASAGAFARDLRNVLEHRPIEARPPGVASKVARWVQRNPAVAVSIALAALAAVGVPSALLWQEKAYAREIQGALDTAVAARAEADRQREAASNERDRAVAAEQESAEQRDQARTEARKAEQVAELMTQFFSAASPATARGRELTARDMLDAGIERVESELVDQPDIQAELFDAIGQCYSALSIYDRAEYALRRALELRRQVHGERSLQVSDSYYGLALMQRSIGDREALANARRSDELHRELAPADLRGRVDRLLCLSLSAIDDAEREFSFACVQEAYDVLQRIPDADPRLRGNVLTNLANSLYREQRYEDALRIARESLELERSIDPAPHPAQASSLNIVALTLKRSGRLDEALEAYDQLIDVGRELFGERNDRYATFLLNKASLLEDLERVPEALELLRAARGIFEETTPPTHPQRLTVLGNLGGLCARSARWAEGCEAFEAVLPHMIETHGEGHPRVAYSRYFLGLCLDGEGRLDDSARELRTALDATIANYGADDPRVARIQAAFAALRSRDGEHDAQTRTLAEAALATMRGRSNAGALIGLSALALGRVELRAGRDDRAVELLRESAQAGRMSRPDHWSGEAAALELAALGLPDVLLPGVTAEQTLAYVTEQLGDAHPDVAHCRALLATPTDH